MLDHLAIDNDQLRDFILDPKSHELPFGQLVNEPIKTFCDRLLEGPTQWLVQRNPYNKGTSWQDDALNYGHISPLINNIGSVKYGEPVYRIGILKELANRHSASRYNAKGEASSKESNSYNLKYTRAMRLVPLETPIEHIKEVVKRINDGH